MLCLMLTSPAADTLASLCFPTTLTSHLPAIEDDTPAPCLIRALFYTRAHCVTGRDRLSVLMLSKSCASIEFGIQLV